MFVDFHAHERPWKTNDLWFCAARCPEKLEASWHWHGAIRHTACLLGPIRLEVREGLWIAMQSSESWLAIGQG